MKLVIIYGPPATGKMTIAKELAKITNARYFPHNLIFELIMPVITEDINDDDLWDLYENIKIEIIKIAKKKDNSLILTEIYSNPLSNGRFRDFIRKLKKFKINYSFVKLKCSSDELLRRVVSQSRKNTKKVNTKNVLKKIMKKGNLNSEIPFVKNLVIDNTQLSVKEVVKEIKEKFKLK